jgi:hypothetical protein
MKIIAYTVAREYLSHQNQQYAHQVQTYITFAGLALIAIAYFYARKLKL